MWPVEFGREESRSRLQYLVRPPQLGDHSDSTLTKLARILTGASNETDHSKESALRTHRGDSVVPPLVFRMCGSIECRVEDFGGGLALLASAAASVLLAWRTRTADAQHSWRGLALPAVVIWGAGAVWLASLEGVIDDYTPRILLAALLAPVGGAIAWARLPGLSPRSCSGCLVYRVGAGRAMGGFLVSAAAPLLVVQDLLSSEPRPLARAGCRT
jgi:hypothetical protein